MVSCTCMLAYNSVLHYVYDISAAKLHVDEIAIIYDGAGEIPLRGGQGYVQLQSIPKLLMTWWCKDPATNGFSFAIHIRWKFCFTLTSILIYWSLRNFVHGTTAVLSWHVPKFVAIWWSATELQQGEISIESELRAKTLVKRAPAQ